MKSQKCSRLTALELFTVKIHFKSGVKFFFHHLKVSSEIQLQRHLYEGVCHIKMCMWSRCLSSSVPHWGLESQSTWAGIWDAPGYPAYPPAASPEGLRSASYLPALHGYLDIANHLIWHCMSCVDHQILPQPTEPRDCYLKVGICTCPPESLTDCTD